MRHIDRIERLKPSCVAVGSFDGIHLGHQAVLGALTEESRRRGMQSGVVSLVCGQPEKALTTELEKEYLLEKMGVDVMLSLSVEQPDAGEQIRKQIVGVPGAELFVAGASCPERRWLEESRKALRIVEEVSDGGTAVTTERVAACLDAGDMEAVTRLCGHPYYMLGKVVHGKALGRTVGMPTANLKIYGTKRRPPNGVYATRTYIGGKPYFGVTNVGLRPSVDSRQEITIETMLADFQQDIYGEKIITEFPLFLRGIRKFDGIEAVWEQVQKDIQRAMEYFSMTREFQDC